MISTKGRYAVRFMLDLAEQPEGIPVPLDDAAQRQQISKKYLEIVVMLLVSAKLVKGASGKGGGYRLSRLPESYRVGEILRITETSLAPVSCLECGAEKCSRAKDCRTLPMWSNLDRMINDFFDGITLADLIKKD